MADILAPITGNVLHVLATVGDVVTEGDTVAILESMKLEIPVEAESAGTVTTIHITEGDAIAEADVMFVLV
jgi:acetyl-CoA carboxylase biotin carboxyl carrier protein